MYMVYKVQLCKSGGALTECYQLQSFAIIVNGSWIIKLSNYIQKVKAKANNPLI